MVALGPVAAGGLKESNFSFDSNCKNMDDLNEFCKANQLFKTTLVIGGFTIPPENLPCFEFLVLLAIIVFLLLFILIVYCCYRCRLKKRWAMPLCKNLADNNLISYFQKTNIFCLAPAVWIDFHFLSTMERYISSFYALNCVVSYIIFSTLIWNFKLFMLFELKKKK